MTDKEVLTKFKNGNAIDTDEEFHILERYRSTGMVHIGFDYKLRKGTASLTKQGKWFLKQL